jgi:hypothetical protein
VAEAKSGFTLEAKLNSLKHERQVELGHKVLCQDMVSTPRTQTDGDVIEHYGDSKPYFIINVG